MDIHITSFQQHYYMSCPLCCSLSDPFIFQGSPAPVTPSLYSHTPVPGTVLGHVTLKHDTMLPQQLGFN